MITLIETISVLVVLASIISWPIIFIGKWITRKSGKCPQTNACFNTKCKWIFFCNRFETIAFNIEHAKQMLAEIEKKKNKESQDCLVGTGNCDVLFVKIRSYNVWSVSEGIYFKMSSTRQFKIRQRSLIVSADIFSLCFSLDRVLEERWCFVVSVYQFSLDSSSADQNGE